MLDPKMLAEVRASWVAVADNAQKAAVLMKPHAQELGRQLEALKPLFREMCRKLYRVDRRRWAEPKTLSMDGRK